MTPADDSISEYHIVNGNAANIMFAELQVHAKGSDIESALRRLLQRIYTSIEALTMLMRRFPDGMEHDGATILRTIYDAHLQCLYILKEPTTRAKLYGDFYWIEWTRFVEVIDSQPETFFKLIGSSPKRAQAEIENRKTLASVEANYLTKKNTLRKEWFAGNLAEIAKDVGYEGEYRVMSRLLNPSVHSSVYALQNGGSISMRGLVSFAWTFFHRCMGMVLKHEGLLRNLESELLDNFIAPNLKPIFDLEQSLLDQLRLADDSE